jgi:hypothetical protein
MRHASQTYPLWVGVAAAAAAFLLVQLADAAPIPSQGTWTTVLSPRDIDGDGTVDAWHDSSTNLTWLASPEELTYAESVSYIAGLNVFGVTGWAWSNQLQLSTMYHVDLGNVDVPPGSAGWKNTGPFIGLENGGVGTASGWFWTGAPLVPAGPPGSFTSKVFAADKLGLFIYDEPSTSHYNVWAVRAGDVPVAAVPESETWALMVAGLALLVSTTRRRWPLRQVTDYCRTIRTPFLIRPGAPLAG